MESSHWLIIALEDVGKELHLAGAVKRLLVSHKTAEPSFRIPVLTGEPEISPSKSCSIFYETGSAYLLLGPVNVPSSRMYFIYLVALGLSCGVQDLSSPTRD